MAEHAFYFFTPDLVMKPNTDLSETDTEPGLRADEWIIELRDLIRNGDGNPYNFNNPLPSPRYKVSDIAKYARSSASGYAFIIRDTVAGCEWLVITSGYDTSANTPSSAGNIGPGYTSGYIYFQNATNTPANSSYFSSSGFNIQVMFNPDYASSTFAMQFDDTVNLTYTGGDFFNPTTLPADNTTKANAFLPFAQCPRGAMLIFEVGDGVNGSEFMMWIDEDHQSLAIMGTQGSLGQPDQVAVLGNILEPDDPGDTNEAGTLWVEMSFSQPQLKAGGPEHGNGYVDCFSAAGGRLFNQNLVPRKTLTHVNDKTVGGKFKWYPVEVSNGATVKGHLKGTFAREATAFNSRTYLGQLFAEDPITPASVFIKITDSIMIKYPLDIPPFPFKFPTRK